MPPEYAKDFREAALVLNDSPNASAALSRRCLQCIIRHHFHITRRNLYEEIEALLEQDLVPPYLKDDLHALREGGAVGTHPFMEEATSQILDIEPEDAEHMLDVLEALFNFCFVEPKKAEERRSAIAEKYKKKSSG